MDKQAEAAKVNTSYTLFFFLSTVCITFLFSTSFEGSGWLVIMGYALLMYFIWDLIKQLFSPGQSVILFCLTFSITPAILSLVLGQEYPMIGLTIWILATVMAGFLELVYESIFKSIAPKNVIRRLLLVDGKIDKSLVDYNIKHESEFNIKTFAIATAIVVTYCLTSIALVSS